MQDRPSSSSGQNKGLLILLAVFTVVVSVLSALSGLFSPLLTVMSASGFGVLLLLSEKKYIAAFLPLPVFLLSMLFSSPSDACFSLVGLAGGVCLFFCLKKKQQKAYTCACVAVVFLIAFALAFLPLILSNISGEESIPDYLSESLAFFGEKLRSGMISLRNEMTASLGEAAPIIDDSAISDSVTLILSILPAAVIQLVLFYAYLSACLSAFFLKRLSPSLLTRLWEISMSVISALIYIASFLVYVFSALFSDGITPALAVSLNLVIILLPAFTIVGAKIGITFFRSGEWNGMKTIFLIFLILSLFFNVGYLLYLAAFFGAAVTVGKKLREIKG